MVLIILFLIFAAGSFWIDNLMAQLGFSNWWQFAIPILIIWLIYVFIARVIWP